MQRQNSNDFLELADNFYDQKNYDDALKYYKKVLNNYNNTNDNNKVDLFLKVGDLYSEIKNYDKAQEYYKNSLNIYSQKKDYIGKGYSLTGLGAIHEKSNDYEQARDYYKKALKNFQKIQNTEREGILLSLIDNTYESQRAWEDTKHENKRSFHKFEESDHKGQLQQPHESIKLGNNHYDQKNNEEALIYYKKTFNERLRLLSLVSFVLLFVSLLVISFTPPALGYEFSIYSAYPFYLWIFLIFALFLGFVVIIQSALSDDDTGSYIYGFIVMLLADFILLIMPVFRNYYLFGRGDVLSHIGYIKDIISSGYVGLDIYPGLHIFSAILNQTSGISLSAISMVLPAVCYIFFIFSLFAFYHIVFKKRGEVLFALALTSIPIFSFFQTSFTPFNLSFFFIPFFLFVYFKSRQSEHLKTYRILLISLLIFNVVLHPLTSAFLVFLILLLDFSNYPKFSITNITSRIKSSSNLILLILLLFSIWQTIPLFLIDKAIRLYQWLFIGLGDTQLERMSGTAANVTFSIFTLFSFIFYTYGQWVILILMTVVLLFFVYRMDLKLDFLQKTSVLVFMFFILISVLTFLVVNLFSFLRPLMFAMIFILIFISPLLYKAYKMLQSTRDYDWKQRTFKYGFYCLIILIMFSSTFNLYHSPLTKSIGDHVTKNEYVGLEQFFYTWDNEIYIKDLILPQYRFYDAMFGGLERTNLFGRTDRGSILYYNTTPISHFGYNNYTSITGSYPGEWYFILTDLGRNFYPVVYPEFRNAWKFNNSDFEKLNTDSNVDLIFDNGNLQILKTS